MSDLWSWSNATDNPGTLISSSVGSAGDLLVSNLRDPRVGKIWRAGDQEATLSIQFPTTGAVSLFGLFGYNHHEVGLITLKLGTAAGLGDLWEHTFDPVVAGPRAVFVLRDAAGDLAPVDASHATISAGPGVPLEIGRVWVGHADWKTAYGHAVDGSGWGGEDLSLRSRTRLSGALLGNRGARLRTFTANYQMLRPEEYAGALFRMDEQGVLRQMLFVPDPAVYDPSTFAILGYLDEIPSTNWRAFMTAGRAITIKEAG